MPSYKRLLSRYEIRGTNGNMSIKDITKRFTSAATSNIMKKCVEDSSKDMMVA